MEVRSVSPEPVVPEELHGFIVDLEDALFYPCKQQAQRQQATWVTRVNRLWVYAYGEVSISGPTPSQVIDMLVNDFLGPGRRPRPPWLTSTYYEQLSTLETTLGIEPEHRHHVGHRILMVWGEVASKEHDVPPMRHHPRALVLQEAIARFGIWDPVRKKFTDTSRAAISTTAIELLTILEDLFDLASVNDERDNPDGDRNGAAIEDNDSESGRVDLDPHDNHEDDPKMTDEDDNDDDPFTFRERVLRLEAAANPEEHQLVCQVDPIMEILSRIVRKEGARYTDGFA